MSSSTPGGGGGSGGGSDSRFFTTQKKGEMHELRLELHSTDRTTKVDAVKKVIASMTVGKDVSGLFTDVLNCVQTGNIELKKLVYLYLINYAKSQPELTLLAVNTFVKDANDPNPLIRALAVRTMGCIRVDRITEYLCEPLGRALRDEDPVRLLSMMMLLLLLSGWLAVLLAGFWFHLFYLAWNGGGDGTMMTVLCLAVHSLFEFLFIPIRPPLSSTSPMIFPSTLDLIFGKHSTSGRRQPSASPNSTTSPPTSSKSAVSSKRCTISSATPTPASSPTAWPRSAKSPKRPVATS